MYTPNHKPVGRPTKKTKRTVDALLKVIATGAPYSICCAAVGINPDTFAHWKRTDAAFAEVIEQTAAKSALRLLSKIEAHAEDNFAAAAWILERRFPETFSRPEIQLGVQINSQTVNQTLVITTEIAGEIGSRVREVDAKIEKLLKDKRNGGNGSGVAPADPIISAMVLPSIIVMPPDPLPSHWWSQLVRGDNTREVERATAIRICRIISADVFGQLRSQNTPVEFAEGPILLRDVHARLESLCGADGWAALRKRGEA